MHQQPRSQAMRVPEEAKIESKSEVSMNVLEDSVHLTTEDITKGVQQAREAMNAPPIDLLAFESALKQKHDELRSAGMTPVLIKDKAKGSKPRFKVAITK